MSEQDKTEEPLTPEDALGALESLLAMYPPDIFDGSSGDEGPTRIVAARAALPVLRDELARLELQGHSLFGKGQTALADELATLRAALTPRPETASEEQS